MSIGRVRRWAEVLLFAAVLAWLDLATVVTVVVLVRGGCGER